MPVNLKQFFLSLCVLGACSVWAEPTSSLAKTPSPTKSNSSPTSDDRNWRLVKNKNDIHVYAAHTDNSRMKTFRGITTLTTKNPMTLVGALNDYDYMPNWMHFVTSATEIKRNSYFHRNLRITTKVPWPLKPREALVAATITQNPHTSGVQMQFSNTPNLLPLNKDFLRVPEFYGLFNFEWVGTTENNEYLIQVTYEAIVDPGGTVPAWLANLILTEVPYHTLRSFKRLIASDKYQNNTDDGGIEFPAANTFTQAVTH